MPDLVSSRERIVPTGIHTIMDSFAYESTASLDLPAQLETARVADGRSLARERSIVLRRLLLVADVVAAALGGLLTSLVFGLGLSTGVLLTAAVMAGSVMLSFFFGLYNDGGLRGWASGLSDAPRMLVAALLLSWPIFGVAALANLEHAALVALVATTATASIDSLARSLSRGWVHRVTPLRQRTVIVGSGMVAEKIVQRLERHDEFGLEAIGLVDDEVHALHGVDLPKLGSLDQLHAVLDAYDVDRVIIAFSRATHDQLLSCIRVCRDHRVAVDVVPRLFELLDGARSLSQIGGLPMLSIGAPPLSTFSRAAKRVLDIVISAVALIMLSPVLIAVAILIKLDSRGPVLFKQVRAGRGATPFKLLKFRSMYRDAEERKAQYEQQNEANDGVMFKIKRDPRITRIGRVLRRTSLDEMPQLINVLLGDMSLVGPRPLILSESEHAAQTWHARRLDLRPGMTGLWQVSGRSDLPFQEMVRFDYQYVAGWSLARDLEILLATFPVVLSGRGAY
jgi:exopolysaccharide biosynthesis polyprenyl glycosylphosphotransferase